MFQLNQRVLYVGNDPHLKGKSLIVMGKMGTVWLVRCGNQVWKLASHEIKAEPIQQIKERMDKYEQLLEKKYGVK